MTTATSLNIFALSLLQKRDHTKETKVWIIPETGLQETLNTFCCFVWRTQFGPVVLYLSVKWDSKASTKQTPKFPSFFPFITCKITMLIRRHLSRRRISAVFLCFKQREKKAVSKMRQVLFAFLVHWLQNIFILVLHLWNYSSLLLAHSVINPSGLLHTIPTFNRIQKQSRLIDCGKEIGHQSHNTVSQRDSRRDQSTSVGKWNPVHFSSYVLISFACYSQLRVLRAICHSSNPGCSISILDCTKKSILQWSITRSNQEVLAQTMNFWHLFGQFVYSQIC